MENRKNTLPNINSNIRILHALPKYHNIDIYANGLLIAKNIAFSKISKYFSLVPRKYEIQIYKSGFYDNPIYSQTVTLTSKQYYTICLTPLNEEIYFLILKDGSIIPKNSPSFLRFINLSPNSPLLSLSLPNNEILFDSVEYLETTDYYNLSSGIYNFQVAFFSDETFIKYIKNIMLDNGKFYTIYIIGLFKDKPKLGYLLVQDSK